MSFISLAESIITELSPPSLMICLSISSTGPSGDLSPVPIARFQEADMLGVEVVMQGEYTSSVASSPLPNKGHSIITMISGDWNHLRESGRGWKVREKDRQLGVAIA